MIDADDFIAGKLPVESFDDSLDGYIVKVVRGSFSWSRAQIFNLGKKLWWYEEPIHEYAICEQPMNVKKLEGDYAWEVRTEGCRSRQFANDIEKYKNDYEVLKKYIEKDPTSVRKQFYLAQSAFDARMYDIAEQEYLKRVEMKNWDEEVFFSWMRVGICRELQDKPIAEVADAFMRAFEVKPNRVEPLYHLSCIYRKHERPRDAFLVASHALTIPIPQNEILFVDHANYLWGILDEVATTAFYAGRVHMGFAACEKLLSEPHLPAEHRARVESNRQAYLTALQQVQMQMNGENLQTMQNVQQAATKIPQRPVTTLDIDPKKIAVKI
jgi:tetratricopeptide (TPR) repeat protein